MLLKASGSIVLAISCLFKNSWEFHILPHHLHVSDFQCITISLEMSKIHTPGACTVFGKRLCRRPSTLWQGGKPSVAWTSLN